MEGECSMQGEEGAILEQEVSMQGQGSILEAAGPMQLGMATPTSSTSVEAAGGESGNTGMASILDLMADGLAYTLDRKADIEQALLEDLLASLRKEQQKLEADAARLAVSPSQP